MQQGNPTELPDASPAAAEAAPLVSVIVPVWNNAGQLKACLDALAAQTLPRDLFEIIVADNGSTDGSADVAGARPGVTVVSEARPGSYIARNTAARRARGRYLAFTDSDCLPDPAWLEAALDRARSSPDVGLVAGPIALFADTDDGRRLFKDYETLFSFPQDPSQGNCATANWLSPRDVVLGVGGFDESMKSGADKDLALRIRSSGKVLAYAPAMVVNHPVRATLAALVNKRRRLTGGRWTRTTGRARLLRALRLDAAEMRHRLRKTWRAAGLGAGTRLQIAGLVVWLGLVSAGETLRLASGGAPVR